MTEVELTQQLVESCHRGETTGLCAVFPISGRCCVVDSRRHGFYRLQRGKHILRIVDLCRTNRDLQSRFAWASEIQNDRRGGDAFCFALRGLPPIHRRVW